jgi:hypothetical protein
LSVLDLLFKICHYKKVFAYKNNLKYTILHDIYTLRNYSFG